MEFRILGSVEIVGDDGPIPVGGNRERALLVRLLLSANQVVSSAALTDDLWSGAPPDGAAQALWVHVSRLRKALRGQGTAEVLITRAPGYLLQVEPEAIDAYRFAALVARGRKLMDGGEPAQAAAAFRAALALWRGGALADVPETAFAQAEAARLNEARLGAIEACIDAELAAGRADELIGELASLTREHPLRERLWGQRMVALYRAGRQAEALRTYQELRRYLGEELGIDPSDELRALEAAILRHEPHLARPEPAHRATPAGSDRLALPVPLARQDSVFVRPEADIRRLEAAWETARAGRRQFVLLAGEPGIGKTRLSAEIGRIAHDSGAAVLYGRCEEGMGVPYQPFVEALEVYLRQSPAPTLGRLARELARLAPDLGSRFGDLPPPLSADPETERYRLFDAVAVWLAAVTDHAPTVLIVEDLHWATHPTLAMLRHLARSGEPGPLLVVVNYRDTDLDLTPELADTVADLLRQPDVERLRLGGLDPGGVAAYLEAQARHELDAASAELAGVLHAETAGNPFFVNQMIRHLVETGALTRHGGRWSAADPPATIDVPDSVRDVIARRLARLPDETEDVLELAAVQGDRFDLRVLVEAAGQPQVSVLRALDPAISARLVTEADGLEPAHRFVHALVRHTLYDRLSSARRMELHRAVGTALTTVAGEDWPDHVADLARHWLAGTPRVGATPAEARRTLDYAEEAARRANASLAYEEAAGQLARALPFADLIDEPSRKARTLVALGEAQYHAGDGAYRQTLRDAAELALELGDGELAAHSALITQRPPAVLGAPDADRLGLLERVVVALGRSDTSARARVLVAMATELHFAGDPRRDEVAREAVAVARRLDDPSCLAYVLGMAAYAMWAPGTLSERVPMVAEMNGLAAELDDPVLQIVAGLALYYTAAEEAHIDQAREALATATRAADVIGQPALRLRTVLGQTGYAMLEGRFADQATLADEARRLGEALGTPEHVGVHEIQRGALCLLEGRSAEAVGHFAVAVERLPHQISIQAALAWAHAQAGRRSEAQAVVAGLGGARLEVLPRNVYTTVIGLAAAAGAAVALGDRDLAAGLYDDLLPVRHQVAIAQSLALGPVAHHLGGLAAVLGRTADAEAHFAYACDLQERTGARGFLVHTRLAWARLLSDRSEAGAAEHARTLAEAAVKLAEELNLPRLAQQAAELLRPRR